MPKIEWYDTPDQLKDAAQARMIQVPDGTLLEVGPYIRPQIMITAASYVFVEPHLPYIEYNQRQIAELTVDGRRAMPMVYVNATADAVLPLFADATFDVVFAGDVIEHLDREAGLRLIAQAQRLARRQAVLFTPLGFMPQRYTPGFIDAHGVVDCHWQEHRSGWTPEDFGPEWDILACRRYHMSRWGRPEEGQGEYGAFFALYTRLS